MLGTRRVLLMTLVFAATLLVAPAAAFAGDGAGSVHCHKGDTSPVCNVNAGTPDHSGSHKGGSGGSGGG